MKKAPFLHAVYPIIGGIKVENQFFRRFGKRSNKLLYQYLVYLNDRPIGQYGFPNGTKSANYPEPDPDQGRFAMPDQRANCHGH